MTDHAVAAREVLRALVVQMREVPRHYGVEFHAIDEGVVVAAFRLASKEDTERVAKKMHDVIEQIICDEVR